MRFGIIAPLVTVLLIPRFVSAADLPTVVTVSQSPKEFAAKDIRTARLLERLPELIGLSYEDLFHRNYTMSRFTWSSGESHVVLAPNTQFRPYVMSAVAWQVPLETGRRAQSYLVPLGSYLLTVRTEKSGVLVDLLFGHQPFATQRGIFQDGRIIRIEYFVG